MAHVRILKLDRNRTPVITYNIYNMESFSYNLSTPVSPLPLPEEGADENILVKVEGNSARLSLVYKIKHEVITEDSEPIFEGIETIPNPLTIFHQWNIIQEEFVGISIDDAYRFEFIDDMGDTVAEFEGFIIDFALRTTGDTPTVFTASIDFLQGNVVTTYEQDGASPPLNVSVTPGNDPGEVVVFWSRPTNTGTGNPSITGYRVQSMEPGDVWRSHSAGSSATALEIDGLAPGLSHSFRVAALTGSQQVGSYSPAVVLVVP